MNLRKEESKAHTLWDTLVGDPDHAVRRIEQLMQPGTMMNPKGILATGSSG